MRRSDDPAPGDYDDYYIASTLRSESSTLRLDQTIPFTTRDTPEHDALQKADVADAPNRSLVGL